MACGRAWWPGAAHSAAACARLAAASLNIARAVRAAAGGVRGHRCRVSVVEPVRGWRAGAAGVAQADAAGRRAHAAIVVRRRHRRAGRHCCRGTGRQRNRPSAQRAAAGCERGPACRGRRMFGLVQHRRARAGRVGQGLGPVPLRRWLGPCACQLRAPPRRRAAVARPAAGARHPAQRGAGGAVATRCAGGGGGRGARRPGHRRAAQLRRVGCALAGARAGHAAADRLPAHRRCAAAAIAAAAA